MTGLSPTCRRSECSWVPLQGLRGVGGSCSTHTAARPAHDRPRAPGMECAYLKVSHVSQRTGPFFGKPPEAFGEAAWRWPRGPWSLSREARWVRRPGLLGPGAPSASPGRYGTPQPRRAPRTLGRALAAGLRLLRAGTSVPEPGGRRGAGGPGSRSPARPAKTQEVGGWGEQCHTEWPRSDILPTPGRRQSPSRTAWGHLPLGSWSSRVPDARWSQCSVELCKVAQRSWPIFFF